MQYLSVKNFEKYQHYKRRNPPWVKLYYALLDDFGFLALPERAQLLYVKLLLIASRTANQIPADVAYLSKVCRSKVLRQTVESLIGASFVLASGPLLSSSSSVSVSVSVSERASCYQDASVMLAPRKQDASKSIGKTEWPEAFVFTPKHQLLAEGFSLNVQREFATFRDKAQAHGWRYKNWDAAFRNWLNKAVEIREEK